MDKIVKTAPKVMEACNAVRPTKSKPSGSSLFGGARDDSLSWNLSLAKQCETQSEYTTWIHEIEDRGSAVGIFSFGGCDQRIATPGVVTIQLKVQS